MDPDDLVDAVADKLELYVMSGRIASKPIGDALATAAFGDRIANFDDLLRLHYLLEPETVRFAESLPEQVRELRTSTSTETTLTRSEVSSRIDWNRTIRERYERNPDDETIFVTQSRREEYDIPENIVLRTLVDRIDEALETWADELTRYEWGDRWSAALVERTRRTIAGNVNLERIRSPKANEPSASMLQTAQNSRHTLYKEAAERYLRYDDILNATDPEVVNNLLRKTLIVPGQAAESRERQNSTLFELYVLFETIECLESLLDVEGTLRPIRRGRDAVAVFDLGGEDRILVFYEQAATAQGFSFLGSTKDIDPASITRREQLEDVARTIGGNVLDKSSQARTNRPDVFVVYESDGEAVPERSLVVEVKYQGRGRSGEQTIERGITETLEYLSYMRHNDDLVFTSPPSEWYGNGPNGLLVIDDIADEPVSVGDSAPIYVTQARDLSQQLNEQLPTILDLDENN